MFQITVKVFMTTYTVSFQSVEERTAFRQGIITMCEIEGHSRPELSESISLAGAPA